ncbi:hypothetical protein ASAC_0255 [Acidilobus saccharovorans 345-15]|uniref:Uncharacterized protein n=1 Tax=Acidilobus saccharovorans (strain DSM 16705 / JCM 18335 / VKM B-2471 / 345-15) TaxID=666510 RepID=D9Q024_ACIS3|nr:hypothetical protein [Acidilobus saccharovorans]ADL18662.1 hypothetical protein ASAC_0255 [Acidilobus saccharovorans 345-15]
MIEKNLLDGNYVIKLESEGLKTFIIDTDVGLKPGVRVDCVKALNYNGIKLCYVKRPEGCTLVVLITENRSEVIGCYVVGYAGAAEGARDKCAQCAKEFSAAIDAATASKVQ